MLANFGGYALGLRKDASIDVSTNLKFNEDKIVFSLILRVDGQGRWNAPMTPMLAALATAYALFRVHAQPLRVAVLLPCYLL